MSGAGMWPSAAMRGRGEGGIGDHQRMPKALHSLATRVPMRP